ncbi:MAG: acyl-CoA dehydrogenase [Spongiibacteraceae bacterium]|jgi:acyl-CoA dehydrogenase|nr:acyl-CoA dehydrogenase [Spongiibacteraceae bacterium]
MAVQDWNSVPTGSLTLSGAEAALPDHIRDFQATLRDFALKVMRPIGQQLDKMSPEEAIAEDSPYWEFRQRYLDLGVRVETLMEMEPNEAALLFSILFEELGYGDSGLAISVGAAILPQWISAKFGRMDLLEEFPDEKLGCWAITEPDHGSDMLDPNGKVSHPTGNYGRPNCVATLKDGSITLNGQKSAWVSNGVIAEVCILYCAADTGDGPDPEKGCVLVFPTDLPGVSRGKPLDKLGQRALCQGELFFDNVNIPEKYLLAGPEDYLRAVYCIHTEANALMGATFAGLAQAAAHLAHDYVHERKQGGVPIIQHQSVKSRLFHLFRKTEMARALTRRVLAFNNDPTNLEPSLCSAMFAKTTSTQTAFEVTSDALQLFGGNGLSREYPIEKMLRDARASMIEDGCNEVLSIKGGSYLYDPEKIDGGR